MSGYDLDDAPVSGGSEKNPRVDELVEVLKLTDKYRLVRPIGKIYAYGIHWIRTKKRDGSSGSFPTKCLSFDPETGRRDSTKKCVWCAHKNRDDKNPDVRFSVDYYMNVIDRAVQRKMGDNYGDYTEHEQRTGLKENKETEASTPARALRLTGGTLRAMKALKELNVHDVDGTPTSFGVSDRKYGADVNMKYDKDGTGAGKYPMQISDKTSIKKSESKILLWDLSNLMPVSSTYEEDCEEYKRWAERCKIKANALSGKKSSDDEDDDNDTGLDDEDEIPAPKAKKKPKPQVDDDDDDEAPKPKRKSPPPDEDDDEDETPKPKRKSPPPDDDDDEDEVPKPKKKAKPPVDDDEDEEETPKPKRKSPPPEDDDEDEEPKPKKKAKKPPVDEDEDEDEAPKPKRKSPPPDDDEDEDEAPKPKKKPKKQVDEDEDDDF